MLEEEPDIACKLQSLILFGTEITIGLIHKGQVIVHAHQNAGILFFFLSNLFLLISIQKK